MPVSPFAVSGRRRARGAASLALALVLPPLLAAGCADRPAAGGPYAELVARYVPRIEEASGIRFKAPPAVAERRQEEVAVFVRQQLASARAQRQVTGQEAAYRLLGLIPDTMRLGALLQRLLEEQVVGYYDPRTDTLFVVAGAPKALLEQTVAHELVHALQDQYVRMDSIMEQVDDADRQLAVQAVMEGHAVSLQLRTNPTSGPMMKMPGGWDRIRDMIRDGQVGMPVFASAPAVVREGLLFPYLGGADFVRRFIAQRPESALFGDLPVSSAQLLHDDAYFTADPSARLQPVPVTLPPPGTGTLVWSNTFGEFELRLFLTQYLRDDELVRRAAGGVTGDRMAVVRTPAGEALVWATAWRTPVDAAEFLDAATEAARKRYQLGKLAFPPGATTRRLEVPARDGRAARTVLVSVAPSAGAPLATYVDVPAALGRSPIDLARITRP